MYIVKMGSESDKKSAAEITGFDSFLEIKERANNLLKF